MTEDRNAEPEGWQVPHRLGLTAALAIPVALLALLIVAGFGYNRTIRPAPLQPVTTFPGPGVETFVHDGVEDPQRPHVRTQADPRVQAAKRAVVRDGLAEWTAAR